MISGVSDMWCEPVTGYVRAMDAAGRSPKTMRLHVHYVRHLAREYPDPWAVTLVDLQDALTCETWSASARKSARSVWRGFFHWAHGVGLTGEWVAERLGTVTVPMGLPRPAPETVVAAAVRADERVRFMALLAAHAGLRAGEISLVHERDLVAGDSLLIHGKGQRERIVPIMHDETLRRLTAVRGYAFPGRDPRRPLTAGYVSRLMSAAMPDGWTAHNLRHQFATSAYDGTGDLLAVRELLGHATVQTTQIYVKVSTAKLRAAARAAA